MAKPNYQFEKRQRDIAKKKKKDEKRSKKLTKDGLPVEGEAEDQPADAGPAPAAGEPSAS